VSNRERAQTIWNFYQKWWGSSMKKASNATGIDYDEVRRIVPRLVHLDLLERWYKGHRATGNFDEDYEEPAG
jgi:hypothetical protein